MQINLGACDWKYEKWLTTFYPLDLPSEWRLDYYQNEFPAILLQESHWRALDKRLLSDSLEEAREGFTFFFEISSEDDISFLVDIGGASASDKIGLLEFNSEQLRVPAQDYGIQRAHIRFPENWNPSEGVFRINADTVLSRIETRHLFEVIMKQFPELNEVSLFFQPPLIDMTFLNDAKIIADLMSS